MSNRIHVNVNFLQAASSFTNDITGLVTSETLNESLNEALSRVNKEIEADHLVCGVDPQRALDPKSPIFLQLTDTDGSIHGIGITHFAHLTPDFAKAEFSEVARTIDELAQSILKAIEIYKNAGLREGVLITSIGTPFYIGSLDITIRDKVLFIEGKPILYNETPLEAHRLTGEEGLTFKKLETGDYTVASPVDHRTGAGIFFKLSQDSGSIYRA